MDYSAGIIPFRINDSNEMEFFVGHPVEFFGLIRIIGLF